LNQKYNDSQYKIRHPSIIRIEIIKVKINLWTVFNLWYDLAFNSKLNMVLVSANYAMYVYYEKIPLLAVTKAIVKE